MPDPKKYILSYRPRDYTSDSWLSTRGSLCKKPGLIEDLPTSLIKLDMPAAFRLLLERSDQLLMHGEYLPDLVEGEEEIVRIVLDNNETDTWSVRARNEGGAIKYTVVDEYETIYGFSPVESQEPLTFEEMISLLDSIRDVLNPDASITNPYRDYNLHLAEHPEEDVEFVTVFSRFYPELTEWYYEEAVEWLEYFNSKYPRGN
jgi:hypothetical protein